MSRWRSVIGSATCGTAATLVLASEPAQADDTPASRSGWPHPRYDAQSWGLLRCQGTTIDVGDCGISQSIPESTISSDGSWSADYPVRRYFPSYDGSATIACDPGCNVVAFMLVETPSRPGIMTASAPVTFANPK